MSNETTQKRSLSVSLGAAFLMATSAIGPGFLTQTSQFTAKYLSSFAFVIVCVIIMDMIAQTNVWSIVGVSGLRGQEIANKVLPGLGYLLVVLVVLGGLAFNIGNVGGVSLGFNAMIGIPEKAGVIIGGVLAVAQEVQGSGDRLQTEITVIRSREAATRGGDVFESALVALSGAVSTSKRESKLP